MATILWGLGRRAKHVLNHNSVTVFVKPVKHHEKSGIPLRNIESISQTYWTLGINLYD